MQRILCISAIILFAVPAKAQTLDSLIRKSVYFGGGSYYIDEYQIESISEFINGVEKLENYEIILFSHTDNIGGVDYNRWLSRQRSEAVLRELIFINVPEELIEIRDFGQNNPLYTNYSRSGRYLNRRVDIILWPIVF